MKIAILVPNYSDYSGDAKVVQIQAEECLQKGNDVTIISLNADIKFKNIEILEMGMPKNIFYERIYRLLLPIDLFKTIKWVPKLKNYDLIISHNYPMNWFAFLAKIKYKSKYYFWYHGIPDPETYPKKYEKIYLKLFILFTKLTVQNADQIYSVSNSAKLELKERTNLESKIIYNKPDLNRFNDKLDGSKLRAKYNLNDSLVLLNVGRICPQKGADILINSFLLIKNEIPNAKLVFVGKHTYDYFSKQLMEICDDSVIFTGFITDDELPYYYAMCDIYTTCSLWETFNLPIAEAQACGKPVIAFDIGPHKEVIDKNGVLVKKIDAENFANACINKKYDLDRGKNATED